MLPRAFSSWAPRGVASITFVVVILPSTQIRKARASRSPASRVPSPTPRASSRRASSSRRPSSTRRRRPCRRRRGRRRRRARRPASRTRSRARAARRWPTASPADHRRLGQRGRARRHVAGITALLGLGCCFSLSLHRRRAREKREVVASFMALPDAEGAASCCSSRTCSGRRRASGSRRRGPHQRGQRVGAATRSTTRSTPPGAGPPERRPRPQRRGEGPLPARPDRAAAAARRPARHARLRVRAGERPPGDVGARGARPHQGDAAPYAAQAKKLIKEGIAEAVEAEAPVVGWAAARASSRPSSSRSRRRRPACSAASRTASTTERLGEAIPPGLEEALIEPARRSPREAGGGASSAAPPEISALPLVVLEASTALFNSPKADMMKEANKGRMADLLGSLGEARPRRGHRHGGGGGGAGAAGRLAADDARRIFAAPHVLDAALRLFENREGRAGTPSTVTLLRNVLEEAGVQGKVIADAWAEGSPLLPPPPTRSSTRRRSPTSHRCSRHRAVYESRPTPQDGRGEYEQAMLKNLQRSCRRTSTLRCRRWSSRWCAPSTRRRRAGGELDLEAVDSSRAVLGRGHGAVAEASTARRCACTRRSCCRSRRPARCGPPPTTRARGGAAVRRVAPPPQAPQADAVEFALRAAGNLGSEALAKEHPQPRLKELLGRLREYKETIVPPAVLAQAHADFRQQEGARRPPTAGDRGGQWLEDAKHGAVARGWHGGGGCRVAAAAPPRAGGGRRRVRSSRPRRRASSRSAWCRSTCSRSSTRRASSRSRTSSRPSCGAAPPGRRRSLHRGGPRAAARADAGRIDAVLERGAKPEDIGAARGAYKAAATNAQGQAPQERGRGARAAEETRGGRGAHAGGGPEWRRRRRRRRRQRRRRPDQHPAAAIRPPATASCRWSDGSSQAGAAAPASRRRPSWSSTPSARQQLTPNARAAAQRPRSPSCPRCGRAARGVPHAAAVSNRPTSGCCVSQGIFAEVEDARKAEKLRLEGGTRCRVPRGALLRLWRLWRRRRFAHAPPPGAAGANWVGRRGEVDSRAAAERPAA